MRRKFITGLVCGAALAGALFGSMGCGHKDDADTGTNAVNAQPGGPALSPEQRAAMQAQRQSMSADRAAHAPQRK